jgi:hypothetical protein
MILHVYFYVLLDTFIGVLVFGQEKKVRLKHN